MSMDTEQPASVEDRFRSLLESEEAPEDDAAPEPEAEDAGQAEEDAESEAEHEAEEEAETETDEEEELDTDEPAPLDAIEVEIDGHTRRLTAEQVREGILMRADYTRKTQELAEQRRALEAERQQADAYIRQQLEMVKDLDDPEPDWDTLYDEDPLGAPKKERDWRARQAQRQQANEQRALRQEQARQHHLVRQTALLPELIPEWSDPQVARTEQADLRQALIDDGFSPEDVASVADARLVKWLRAAHRQFQAEKAARGVVKKKVADKPKVQRPGSAKPKSTARTRSNAAREAARKSQSKDAWTKVFEDFV